MKSAMAVVVQMALSGSNYAIFLIMARWLGEPAFVGFSTAVGLNMLAYALAEGGVSYVAPKALAERDSASGATMAGAFIGISSALYFGAMVVGYLVWNALAPEPLQLPWVLGYAAFFAPALWMPAWITCKSIDKLAVAVFGVVRGAMVMAAFALPTVTTLFASGVVFTLLVAWLLVRGNTPVSVVTWPNQRSLSTALSGLKQVFLARTISYAVYASLPLLVGIARGNGAAAAYITAERLKSLYATLFQPVIQSIYLWQFEGNALPKHKTRASILIQLLNICVVLIALLAANEGWLDILGPRFSTAANSPIVWIASWASVASACLLLLHVFPNGNFDLFRRAAWIQMLGFSVVGLWLLAKPGQTSNWLLLGGEVALLLAIVAQFTKRQIHSSTKTP